MAGLQALNGIGPFYSALIVIRGTGFADVLPVGEPRVLDLTARLYELDAPPSEAEFRALAQPWKPLRTWAAVLIRAAADRVLGGAGASAGVR
jgi:DNA-3-methyladenine glycosylase II